MNYLDFLKKSTEELHMKWLQDYKKAIDDFNKLFQDAVKHFEDSLAEFEKTGKVLEPHSVESPNEAPEKIT